MYVKKLELIGFKSFADRTEIHLNQGVTCIVGPNGCGKSNISDAIRWAFGERSAKLLRGSRMEDVIFNGTELRKPMGMAEVSITLDNEDHILPIEYDEVVLTRRLSRSGQSEYFINRTPCRLKDIIDLILDTGMGSNSYSMVEQGRVDSVINADPQERRFLIEEAAGISKYKVKKEEALRKLERTEQNLLRIRDITSEVQKNIQYAEKQARRAERYKTQFEELKKLEIRKAFLDLSELARQEKVEENKKQEILESQTKLERELQEILDKESEQNRILQEILERESHAASRFFELRSESNALAQKREFNRERLQAFQHREIEIQKEREILSTQLDELEQEAQNKSCEREESDEEHKKAEEIFRQEKICYEEGETRLKYQRDEAEKLKALLFENASELVRIKNESNRLKGLLERAGHEQTRRREMFEKLRNDRKAFEKRQLTYQEEAVQASRESQGEESEKDNALNLLAEAKDQINVLEKHADEKKLKLQEIHSRIKLLEELQESAEDTERKLLASASGNRLQGKLVRSLREVIQIQAGYESAVEAVLGAFAQALVAEDVETAQGLMLEMADAHIGPCGIFIQSLVKPNGKPTRKAIVSHPKIRLPIQEAVSIQSGFELLFSPLFENVYVIENFSPENLAELLPLAQETKLVTPQGIILGPEARIFFRNGRLSSDQGPFKRRAEIQALKATAENLNSQVESINSQKNELEKEVAGLEEKRQSLEEKGRENWVRRETAESLLRGLDERLANMEEEVRVLEAEQTESQDEATHLGNRLQELDGEVYRLEEREKELLDQQKQKEKTLQELQREREEQIHNLSRLKTLLENHEKRRRSVETGSLLLKNQIENIKERLIRLNEESGEVKRRTQEILSEEGMIDKKQKVIDEERKEAEQSLIEIRGCKVSQEERHRELSSQSREGEDRIKLIRDGLHEREMKLMDLSYRQKNIFDRMEQTYHVKLAELQEEDYAVEGCDACALDEEIRMLKSRVDSFGPVNLLAVEEFEELKQRYDFLAAQEKDLNEARESLLEAIRKINRTTKTLFAETFAKAQALFQQYYQTLFGGGHAELLLMQSEEGQEEEGIDIMVRPPGKKLQHISLLSGGEKALTAIALLFALFRIRPSPLCVLDEVDAPLDEANVDRFVSVLRTFLGSTQFMIVTHNRKTITIGDFLYGVTMEESGVSKMVSVKVAQREEKEKAVVAA